MLWIYYGSPSTTSISNNACLIGHGNSLRGTAFSAARTLLLARGEAPVATCHVVDGPPSLLPTSFSFPPAGPCPLSRWLTFLTNEISCWERARQECRVKPVVHLSSEMSHPPPLIRSPGTLRISAFLLARG